MARIVGFDIESFLGTPFHPDFKLICASYCGPAVNNTPHTFVGEHPERDTIDENRNIINLAKLVKIIHNPNMILVGHNIAYDVTGWEAVYKRQLKKNIPYENQFKCQLFDTMVAQSLIDENAPNKLSDLAKRYTKEEKIEINAKNLWNIPLADVIKYNQQDAKISRLLYNPLYDLMYEREVLPLFYILMEALRNVIKIQIRGVNVDIPKLDALIEQLKSDGNKLVTKLRKVVGDINYNSPKQLAEVLFEDLGWPVIERTPKGAPATSEIAFARLKVTKIGGGLSKKDKKILDDILETRRIGKLLGTYLIPLKEEHLGWDGRVHSSYFLGRGLDDFHTTSFGTRTGRLSSRNPNLQNIALDLDVRGVLIPTKGYRILKADHSQLELRLAGYLSKDSVMQGTFRDGLDIHSMVTARIYDKPYEEILELVKHDFEWKLKRKVLKTFNFAMIYGAYWQKLQLILLKDAEIELGEHEIKRTMHQWKEQFKAFEKWKARVHECIRQDGVVVSDTGRTRHFFEPENKKNYDWVEMAQFERQGLNTIIQNFASDITVIGWNHLEEELNKNEAHVLLTVHDSLDGEYKPKKLNEDKLRRIVNESLVTKTKQTLHDTFKLNVDDLYLSVEVEANCERWS